MLQLTIAAVLMGVALQGPAGPDPSGIVAQLSDLHLSYEDTYRVRDLTIRRDVLSVSFTRGVLAFLEPVNGRVTGAVFVGSGEVLAIPPDDVERRQMNLFTGSPILNEAFDAAILRFTDGTYREVMATIRTRANEDIRTEDLEALLPRGENLGETSRLLNFRLLEDLLGPSDRPLFFAALRGARLGWFNVAYDMRNEEEVTIGDAATVDGETQIRNVWASFKRRSDSRDLTRYGSDSNSDLDVQSYDIDTTISTDGELSAISELSVVSLRPGERVLDFSLTPSLRVTDVRFEGRSIPFFQHPRPTGSEPRSPMDRFVLVLPRPTEPGQELRLEVDYSGRVLERRGREVYYVSERVIWYPHVGALDPARYRLSFHFPADNVLVATGHLVQESEAGGLRSSVWESSGEFTFAGFNYGDFSIEADESGEVPIYVHVNNDVETAFEELAASRAARLESALAALQGLWGRRRGAPQRVPVLPDYELFSTRRLASKVVRQVRSIMEFFTPRLGKYPFERLSVSQSPVAFSQGWPSLLYVSTLAFFDDEQRGRLSLDGEEFLDTELVLAHEIAHQWFGNSVSWRSYRDQWISEGFANYMALFYLEKTGGESLPPSVILEELRRRLLAESGSGRSFDENGPVWLGQRLATVEAPNGYRETVYPKGTWIIHMLRMLLRDDSDDPDAPFLSMVREFLDQYQGRPASTWDLKAVVERHLTARSDLGNDGRMDWFFNQWVFSTGVPDYVLAFDITPLPGTYAVRGRVVDQQGLGFSALLPVYVRTAAGRLRYVQDLVVRGDETEFDFSVDEIPIEVVLDPFRSVLRR